MLKLKIKPLLLIVQFKQEGIQVGCVPPARHYM